MKKSKYSDSQIVSILKEAEGGQPVKEICRKCGISSACYYQRKSEFKRTRELEAENAKLKRMYAHSESGDAHWNARSNQSVIAIDHRRRRRRDRCKLVSLLGKPFGTTNTHLSTTQHEPEGRLQIRHSTTGTRNRFGAPDVRSKHRGQACKAPGLRRGLISVREKVLIC
jgi:putative transposase